MSGTDSSLATRHSGATPALIAQVFAAADIGIDGVRPWDMHIHHPDTLARLVSARSLAMGESYVDGWWDCQALDEFFFRLLRHGGQEVSRSRAMLVAQSMLYLLKNRQSLRRSRQVAEHHYDLGNDLFEVMLDDTMAYSCGYWRDAISLEQAQRAKLDLVCRKMHLRPGMQLLDIGCGWGSLLEHAARHYGVRATGITVSSEQAAFTRARCRELPVTVLEQDYRECVGDYDRIVSIGMFEHVGRRNYGIFMDTAARCLRDDGLMLLHTIGANHSSHSYDPWINKYIFPNGELPSLAQIAEAAEAHFLIEDLHSFGPDYARTLKAWDDNFQHGWDSIAQNYNQRFYRMWRYYLNACAGAFRARTIQLWQLVLSKPAGGRGSYISVR